MHIHIQNRLHNAFLPITREAVDGTSIVKDHRVTIGDTDADLAEAIRTAEVLVTTLDQLKARFPCAAPHLKAVFLATPASMVSTDITRCPRASCCSTTAAPTPERLASSC